MGEPFSIRWILPTENPHYVEDVIKLSDDFEIKSKS